MVPHQNHDDSSGNSSDHDVGKFPKNEALFHYFALQAKGLLPYMIEESSGVFRVGNSE